MYYYASIKFQPMIKLNANRLGVACGDNYYKGGPDIGWKDALAGAALCGKNKSILLLCDDNKDKDGKDKTYGQSVEAAVTVVNANKGKVTYAYVFGGKLAVSENAMNKLKAASNPVVPKTATTSTKSAPDVSGNNNIDTTKPTEGASSVLTI